MSNQKTAIITGASTGIGRALALEMARHGYDLGLTARRKNLVDALCNDLKKINPEGKFFSAEQDVTKIDESQKIVQNLSAQLGRLDLFIANAGIGYPTPGWKPNFADINTILQTNLIGAVASIEAAKAIMLQKTSGHIVGISSVAGFGGLPASSAYCSSKSGFTTYLQSLRIDLRPFGICVTSILPGFIATPMTDNRDHSRPFMISADAAAKKIFSAIQKKKGQFIFPWQMNLVIRFWRMIPRALYEWAMMMKNRAPNALKQV